MAHLAPNVNYLLTVIFYGSYQEDFCESYLLEVAVAPTSLYNSQSICSTPDNTPDLSGITAQLKNNNNFTYGFGQVFKYNYNGDYSQRQLLAQSFNVTTTSFLRAELGSNFLIGDLRIWLRDENTATKPVSSGFHRRNLHFMDTVLLPGQYTLLIYTGDSQSTNSQGFPACTIYSLVVEIAPMTPSIHEECLAYRHIPHSLNQPQFLGTSPKIHIQESFLIPSNYIVYVVRSTFALANFVPEIK